MHISATSAGRKLDCRDFCGKLTLKSQSEQEAMFLAYLHNVLILGGTITVKPSADAAKCSKHKGTIKMEY